jgi:hypothetical protein
MLRYLLAFLHSPNYKNPVQPCVIRVRERAVCCTHVPAAATARSRDQSAARDRPENSGVTFEPIEPPNRGARLKCPRPSREIAHHRSPIRSPMTDGRSPMAREPQGADFSFAKSASFSAPDWQN